MYRYPIAVDIGNDAIHVAQLGESKKGFFLRGFASVSIDNTTPWDDESARLVKGFLNKTLKESKFTGKKVVIHIPPKCLSSFPLNFQVKKDETIDQIIAGESKSYISYPLEDTIIDYPSLLDLPTGEEKRYRAIIVTTRKSFVESYVKVIKKSGLNIVAIDYDVNSLIRLHTHLTGETKHPVILCNIDKSQTIICAVSDKGILVERHIPWGIKYINERLRKNLDISNDNFKTSRLLMEYGVSYGKMLDDSNTALKSEDEIHRTMRKAVHQIIFPYLEELIDEIHKVTAYLRSDIISAVIKKVYLYGLTGAVRNMDYFIEKNLNIQVQTVNPTAGFDTLTNPNKISLQEDTPAALALGLALRGGECP